MKKLSAREYLGQLQELDMGINQDLEDLEAMMHSATGISGIDYSRDRVQTSPSGDTLCNAVTRYIARNEQINAEIDKFADAKQVIIGQIRGLHVPNYIAVLYKVYVQYKTILTASEEMGLSYNYVITLHGKALDLFEATYKDLHYLV